MGEIPWPDCDHAAGACWDEMMVSGISEHSYDAQPTTMVDSLQCIDNVNTKPTDILWSWTFSKGPSGQTGVGSVSFGVGLKKSTQRIVSFS